MSKREFENGRLDGKTTRMSAKKAQIDFSTEVE